MSVIALENLSVSHRQGYELRTVAHEVNLHIEPGECFGLVGPSGCGKSSLLWVLAGLNGSWQGGFELLGRRLQPGQAFTGELRREVQMVFQDPYASLHPKHRLLRTLSEPLKLLQESDIERKISAAFARWGWIRACWIATRISCRAASGSAWRSCAHCCCGLSCCCWMNRLRRWTCRCRRRSSICSTS